MMMMMMMMMAIVMMVMMMMMMMMVMVMNHLEVLVPTKYYIRIMFSLHIYYNINKVQYK